MAYFISSLLRGMNQMEEIATWLNDLKDPQVGVELIAFTHDDDYWQRLNKLLDQLTCPVTFHGPYINTEATAAEGTKEQQFTIESYQRVLKLAADHQVRHVVYHYTQKGFEPEQRISAQQNEQKNRALIQEMANQLGINLLIENLPKPNNKMPLYTLEEYSELFNQDQTKSIIDIGHAHMNGMDLARFLKDHGNRVYAYHCHNNDGIHDQHREIFDGTFDFKQFSELYRRYTKQADLVLEYEPHVKLTKDQLLGQINWLKETYC